MDSNTLTLIIIIAVLSASRGLAYFSPVGRWASSTKGERPALSRCFRFRKDTTKSDR